VGKNKTVGVIALPDSGPARAIRSNARERDRDQAATRDAVASRVMLLGEVLFHREALARALRAYDDVAVVGSVADVHAALMLADDERPDILIVDSPSDDVAQALAARSLPCKVVFIGPVGERCRQLQSRRGAIFVGASSSLDEVHVALRFAQPRPTAPRSTTSTPNGIGSQDDSSLTRREREVRRLLADGCSNKEIADACGISIATVKNHVHRILGKLNVQRRAQIAHVSDDRPATVPGSVWTERFRRGRAP
jgi:DNA-binding NarL/FixJ family response regulator